MSTFPLLLRTAQFYWIKAYPNDFILTQLPLGRPYLQIQSLFETLDVTTLTCGFGEHTVKQVTVVFASEHHASLEVYTALTTELSGEYRAVSFPGLMTKTGSCGQHLGRPMCICG